MLSNAMAISIPVDIPAEACEVALGPAIKGATLSAGALAAIKQAAPHPVGDSYRTVTCAVPEAQNLLRYFQSITDNLSVLKNSVASTAACAVAADNLRLALQLAGIRTAHGS